MNREAKKYAQNHASELQNRLDRLQNLIEPIATAETSRIIRRVKGFLNWLESAMDENKEGRK